MRTVAISLLFFLVAAPGVETSRSRRHRHSNSGRGGMPLGGMKAIVQALQEDVQALTSDTTHGDAIEVLQMQMSSLQNQTDTQQGTLDNMTSECDCQSYCDRRLDNLEASLIVLQEMVLNITLVLPMPPVAMNGSIRLVNTVDSETNQGRLEIFLFGEWGTVCQDSWSLADAVVACNQLGLPSKYAKPLKGTEEPMSPFGEGSGPIWLNDLLCVGSEANLLDCSNTVQEMTPCDHSMDVGLICSDVMI